MTPDQFVAKWQASTRGERAACQEHFIDLCHLLDEPTPNSDPDGATDAFEKGATKVTGATADPGLRAHKSSHGKSRVPSNPRYRGCLSHVIDTNDWDVQSKPSKN